MEEWALRSMRRWPNVPALFGWLRLDRRGRWLIRDEPISRPQIIDTINANYEADAHGRWFFQNGPQRGYVALDYAPLIAHVIDGALIAHTGKPLAHPRRLLLDEEGSVSIESEQGPALLSDQDLPWALDRLSISGRPVTQTDIEQALLLPSGQITSLTCSLPTGSLAIHRIDAGEMPRRLGFVRDPQPLPGEKVSARIAD